MKRLMYMTMGMALGAALTLSTAVVAQTPPPAAETEEEEDTTPAPAAPAAEEEEAWEVPLPKWSETKTRDWKLANADSFTDNVQTANLNDSVFIAFAKLDGQAPCSDSANCEGWFGSLNEAGRKAALTRLAGALANSFASLGFDRSEVTEMGFTGLLSQIGDNRALLSVARLQRDVGMHDSTHYGIHGITDGGAAIRAKQRLEQRVDKAAEEVEKLDEQHGDLVSAADTIQATITEIDSDAIKNVREKRYAAALAKAGKAKERLDAAKKRLDKLETELAGGQAPATKATAPGSGSGTVSN